MRKKLFILLLIITLFMLNGCQMAKSASPEKSSSVSTIESDSAKKKSSISNKSSKNASSSTTSSTSSTETSSETSSKVISSSKNSTEQSTATQTDISQVKLLSDLEQNKKSSLYHLIFEVLKNTKSTTTQDAGVTYLFSTDANGARATDAFVATYADVSGLSTKDLASLTKGFISAHFSELNKYTDSLVEDKINGNTTLSLTFYDTQISFFTNSTKTNMSVIVSTYE